MPDEPLAPACATDGVEVVGVGAPNAVNGLPSQPGSAHPLEVLAVETEHHRARPRHQDGAIRERLHPPEVARLTGADLFPPLAVEMQNERTPALVGTHC